MDGERINSTDVERFERSSAESRRLLNQEKLILEVTEALSQAIEERGLTRSEVARRLGKTKGFVSQLLAGGRNLTLRTVADVADAIGISLEVQVRDPDIGKGANRLRRISR
ncbi:MAG TPA: helix-turn-helix transcriptional regulator [Candidatus Binataceae bacterium]|nr:helix-turn-helix transcriptional regulator [Candidatus Binataceae bacterium]